MKRLDELHYLLSEGGFAGYFRMNACRGNIQQGLNEIFNVYLHESKLLRDLVVSINDLRYTEYEEPFKRTFKKFNK